MSTSGSTSSTSSVATSASVTASTTATPTFSATTTFPPVGTASPGPPSGGNPNNNNGGGLATSASLYLYTFLATLVLLLSVSGAIVVRSFVLRRRHRRMVEEAIRNGTWVPPAPPSRPARVDLSKKPKMWEAFIDGKGVGGGAGEWYNNTPGAIGDVVGAGKGVAGGGQRADINSDWQHEHVHDWDTIKPFSAAYVSPTLDESTAGPAGAVDASGRMGTSPSTTSINRITPTASPVVTPAAPREPLHRALFTSVRNILNPTPLPTSPLPGPSGSGTTGAVSEVDAPGGAGYVMAELNNRAGKAPTAVRVAVLIAMPKPPGANDTHATEEEEQPLPHIEVGVAEVLVVSHELSSVASGKGESSSSGKPGARGSVGSHDSDLSVV